MPASPDWQKAIDYAIRRLTDDLPVTMYYHSLKHTRDEVVPCAELLARECGVDDDSLQLLRVAAYFHDLGFIENSEGHEMIGVRIARAILPALGFDDCQIEAIAAMIMATRLPQSPKNLLEEILADADLQILGRAQFLDRNRDLRRETESISGKTTDLEWYSHQIALMENHRYFTKAGRAILGPVKRRNLRALRKLAKQG